MAANGVPTTARLAEALPAMFGDPEVDERDSEADDRDRAANERDHDADERDRAADERDRAAAEAEHAAAAGVVDLRERRILVLARHRAAEEREQAALDRAASAGDRDLAGKDRRIAAAERQDAQVERTTLLRDELTGVLRRGAGIIEMEREIARSTRTGDSFVAAFVDVDGLKRINDEHGHSSGDEALREIGQTLRTGMRSYDVALRYGGDEFVCILPGLGVAEATARFESLQAELALASVPVSMTFGLAEWQPGEDIDTLVARADEALYQVRGKRRGNDDSDRGRTDGDDHRAVAAHRMLNSSAVVNMGITTLIAHWDAMTTPDRAALLERMLSHSTSVDDRLKGMTQGTVVLETSSPSLP